MGEDAGMLEMLENRDKLREETGQIIEVTKREDMDKMSDGDREVMAAQDAFAEEMRDARARSGRDWKGRTLSSDMTTSVSNCISSWRSGVSGGTRRYRLFVMACKK